MVDWIIFSKGLLLGFPGRQDTPGLAENDSLLMTQEPTFHFEMSSP